MRVLPDFLIGGAIKSGTTSLYAQLIQHPSIVSARDKELHYFQRHYDRGTTWYRSQFPTVAEMAYRRRTTGAALTGEATPLYLFHPDAPQRVRDTLDSPRLIFVLRDPIERAFSHYKHEVRNQCAPPSFAEAVDRCLRMTNQLERSVLRLEGRVSTAEIAPWSFLLWFSDYATHLEAWFDVFDRGAIRVVFAEDNFAKPDEVTADLHRFLGLSPIAIRAEHRMAGQAGTVDAEVRDVLEEFFSPSKTRLSELLGREIPW